MTLIQWTLGLVVCFLSLVGGHDLRRRCVLYMASCVSHCPQGMHVYHTRCDTDAISQRTCEYPTPYSLGNTCGWSRCDCNGDLVLNENGICSPVEDCIKTRYHRRSNGKKSRRRKKVHGGPKFSKRIHSEDLVDDAMIKNAIS